MRKSIGFPAVLLLLLGFHGSPAIAQSTTIGAKAGLSLATLGADAKDLLGGSLKNRTGLTAGGFVTRELSGVWSLRGEVLFTAKGTTAEDTGEKATVKLNYIQIPVMLQVGIPIEGHAGFQPYLAAGPSVAFELSCDLEVESGSQSLKESCADEDVETKSVDFGVVFGVGALISAGSGSLIFDIDYALGLTNINDTPGTDVFDVTNRAWAFTVGYGIPVGGGGM